MEDDPLIALFKLGQREHMAELLHEGHVFMNPISYFAGLGDGTPRSDPDEGTGFARNMDGWTIDIQDGGEWQPLGTISGPMRLRDQTLATANLYCLHARTRSDFRSIIELNKLGYGDTFVLLLNATEFFRRLQEAAHDEGQDLVFGMVEYVDRSYNGPMGAFKKYSDHAGDREFRIAALPGTGHSLSLRLGDLSDITMMGRADRRIRLDPTSPPNPAAEPDGSAAG